MHFLKTQLFQKAQLQKAEPNSPFITKSIKWTSSSVHKSGWVYVKSIEWMSSSVHKLDKFITKSIKWMSSLVHKVDEFISKLIK